MSNDHDHDCDCDECNDTNRAERNALRSRVLQLKESLRHHTEKEEALFKECCHLEGLVEPLQRKVRVLDDALRTEQLRPGDPAYVPQDMAAELLKMLTAAGFGKPGTGNTLWAMTQNALAELQKLRDLLSSAHMPILTAFLRLLPQSLGDDLITTMRHGIETPGSSANVIYDAATHAGYGQGYADGRREAVGCVLSAPAEEGEEA